MSSALVGRLARICRDRLLEEKWLLAPTRRAGHQWIEQVARAGTPAVNVRVETIKSLAIKFASPALTRQGLRAIDALEGAFVVARAWEEVCRGEGSYLAQIAPSLGLFERLHASIEELRLAGIEANEIDPARFEVSTKGREVRELLAAFTDTLAKENLADAARVLRLAIEAASDRAFAAHHDALLLVAPGLGEHALEKDLLAAFPAERRITLDFDRLAGPDNARPADLHPGALSDLELLRWLKAPLEAPAPGRDGTARIFHAMGETNEVAEVFRCIIAKGIPLDDVEILSTDTSTYLPIVHATTLRHARDHGPLARGVPATFADGLPAQAYRPGRALLGWLRWIKEGCPQHAIVRMLQDGLVATPEGTTSPAEAGDRVGGEGPLSHMRLAATLRTLKIGLGGTRYIPAIRETIAATDERLTAARKASATGAGVDDETDGGGGAEDPRRLERRLADLHALERVVAPLIDTVPAPETAPDRALDGALAFLADLTRSTCEDDVMCRQELEGRIRRMRDLLAHTTMPRLDPLAWCLTAVEGARIGGSRPLPGHIHVAGLGSGGHSGRGHTFILGLDDTRLPPRTVLDPILLDRERAQISDRLANRGKEADDASTQFALLVAQLRGRITLSFNQQDLAQDRELFPSSVLLAAHRILSGRHGDDQTAMLEFLGTPVSLAPDTSDQALTEGEWWLARALTAPNSRIGEDSIARVKPHLGRGLAAVRARKSDEFTVHDGRVDDPGEDLDPAAPAGPVLSAMRLEHLGQCPLRYFFKYVLDVRPPREREVDPAVWLDPLEAGTLLHKVFQDFLAELIAANELPSYERHHGRLAAILEQNLGRARREIVPPSEPVYARQCRHLEQAIHIFLKEEELTYGPTLAPLWVEAAIGMGSGPADQRTPIDHSAPLALRFGNSVVRMCGQLDRVDRDSAGRLHVLDYKSGINWRKYAQADPFDQGRVVQHALYMRMLEALPPREGKPYSVASFTYFFPGHLAGGRRIRFEPGDLSAADDVIERLCRLAAKGQYLASNKFTSLQSSDCYRCDYKPICIACGGLEATCAASERKLWNEANRGLEPMRELRAGKRKPAQPRPGAGDE